MFTEHERSYFEEMLDAKFESIQAKLDHIHDDVKKTNGRVTKLEGEVDTLNRWMASSVGHWSGITKTIIVIWVVLAFVGGIIATWLWH